MIKVKVYRPFPGGNNDVKREARQAIYEVVAAKLPRGSAHVVTLAGPEAAEVPYLRDVLRIPRTAAWFVDIKESGLVEARKAWPGVATFKGPIAYALREEIPAVRFAHLDFMGLYNPEVTRSVRALGLKLVHRGVVTLTFMRGRENSEQNLRARRLAALEGYPGRTREERETQRWIGTFLALQADLGRPLAFLDGFSYRHGCSAMGVMTVQASGPRFEIC